MDNKQYPNEISLWCLEKTMGIIWYAFPNFPARERLVSDTGLNTCTA